MKKITLITLLGLTIFATAATAAVYQTGWGNTGQNSYRATPRAMYGPGGCPMSGNMMGRGMMNGPRTMMGMGRGGAMWGTLPPGSTNGNWRANPSYQGQGPQGPATTR